MTKKETAFINRVWEFYETHARHELPWRKTKNPYRILVSEIMLQQTQVDRVLPKYAAFLKIFPSVQALAVASLGDVLRAWQGLGYNRRAKMLHACAQKIMSEHDGKFPRDEKSLRALPGIGPYTASAILAFAYNIATPLIETNVRTVYIHHFFPKKKDVPDADILKLVEKTLPQDRAHDWYAALMDYGTFLKGKYGNLNKTSKHYTKQSRFQGSDRQIRGAIIRVLTEQAMTEAEMRIEIAFEQERISTQLKNLYAESMIQKSGKYWKI